VLSIAEKLCDTSTEAIPFDVRTYSSRNRQTLGELFVGFFKFYSTFSWDKVISVRAGNYIPMGYGGTWRKPHIRIEDPYERGNVTKAVYEYGPSSAIKQAFKTASEKLEINPSLALIM
jgi:poly(A) RNA polymerase GLD2